MDDTYAALPTSRMQELLDHLNGVERSIQFTAEVESKASSHFWTFCSSKIQTGSSWPLCLEKPPTLIATWTSCLTIPWPTNLRWSRLCTGGSEQSAWMWRRRTRKPDTSDRPSSTTGFNLFVGFSQRTGNLGILLLLHEVWLDITTGRRPTVGSTDTLLWHSAATNSIFPINGPKPLRWVYCYDTADHFHGCRGAFILELTWLPGMRSKPLLAFLFFPPTHATIHNYLPMPSFGWLMGVPAEAHHSLHAVWQVPQPKLPTISCLLPQQLAHSL